MENHSQASNEVPLSAKPAAEDPQRATAEDPQRVAAVPMVPVGALPDAAIGTGVISSNTAPPPVLDSVILPSVAPVTDAEAAGLDLSPAQRTAILLLTSGRTRADAALAAGVSRSTLYRWLTEDPTFQAAFNRWQNDVRTTAQAQLLAATHEAVAVVIGSIRRGNADLAWRLLQAQNMTVPKTAGITDARQLDSQQRLAKRKQDLEDRKKLAQIELDEQTTF